MNMLDIITNKRNGQELTKEEIKFFVRGYTDGKVPDYQASALLMAMYIKGMTFNETENLTLAIRDSGKVLSFGFPVCDKHSTGGVGDGTSLIVAPIVAACGGTVAMMAGRGLGHTGGTVDKLDAIPGYNTSLTIEQFASCVKRSGLSITGQTEFLAPADKKLYALRDVTGTVDKNSLIAASIMGKKLAEGCDNLVIDVKCGSGAFTKNYSEAQLLANTLYSIAHDAGKRIEIVISDMDVPLGNVIGNSLEVVQAIDVLKGKGPEDIRSLSINLAAAMLALSRGGSYEEYVTAAEKTLTNGSAFKKFRDMVINQGGRADYIDKPVLFGKTKYYSAVKAKCSGYIAAQDAFVYGEAARILGAGRFKKEDKINYRAGIKLLKKYGDKVSLGDEIAYLYYDDSSLYKPAANKIALGTVISATEPEKRNLILKMMGDL